MNKCVSEESVRPGDDVNLFTPMHIAQVEPPTFRTNIDYKTFFKKVGELCLEIERKPYRENNEFTKEFNEGMDFAYLRCAYELRCIIDRAIHEPI